MANQTKNLPPAFEIDSRIAVKIELELAVSLGYLILETDTQNTALLALGHHLRSLSNVLKRRSEQTHGLDSDDV